jgi:hypothetical protein
MPMSDSNMPRSFGTPGGRMGDGLQKEILEDAEHDRLAHEAERADQEGVERGEAPVPKRPWWKFWA